MRQHYTSLLPSFLVCVLVIQSCTILLSARRKIYAVASPWASPGGAMRAMEFQIDKKKSTYRCMSPRRSLEEQELQIESKFIFVVKFGVLSINPVIIDSPFCFQFNCACFARTILSTTDNFTPIAQLANPRFSLDSVLLDLQFFQNSLVHFYCMFFKNSLKNVTSNKFLKSCS